MASPAAAHGYRVNCRSLNQLWGPGGSGGGNKRVEYKSWLEFEVADSAVWSLYGTGRSAYLSPFTAYWWQSDWMIVDETFVPAVSIREYRKGVFYYGPAWDHDKYNDANGYNNGTCYTDFTHYGYIWDGVVEFRLEYY